MNNKNNKFIFGFTLAEVLIVVGIIGIIAELTIPTLISNVQEQVLKVSFKKAYSGISQAWMQTVSENPNTYIARGGWGCTWPTGESIDYSYSDGRIDALLLKIKTIKSCINEHGCWPEKYEFAGFLGNTYDQVYQYYSWVTADGMCLAAPWKGGDDTHLTLDTNCEKKPNKIGQDIFSFLLGADGMVYFAIDDSTPNSKPVSSGGVCPYSTDPYIINGRSVSFRDLLYK